MPQARLIDIENVTGKQAFALTRPLTKIGRVTANDFVILQNTISGTHARIEYRDDGFFLADNGSTNKTQLNGTILEPHQPVAIQDGDEIKFDVFRFAFVMEKQMAGQPAQDDTDRSGKKPAVSDRSDSSESDVIRKIGKYETVKKLGKGGFGSVWKARDPKGRIVAIKLLNPENLEDERAVRKFFHEAIILSHLNHPNITQFIDFFPKGGEYIIVMDYEEGSDLKALLRKKKGPFEFKTACKIAGQVLDAFQYAHEKRILHRDIKPENIILDKDGNAKIMDFGIAKMSSATTQKTAFSMISPLYTPPERFDRNSEVDVRSDIYSLGIVFYEIFTGKHPIGEDNPSKVIFAHINQLFDPPDTFADIPANMSQAILKAVEKDPAERFQDFAEFKQALLGSDGMTTVEQAAKPEPKPEPAIESPEAAMPGDRTTTEAPENQCLINVTSEYFQVGVAVMNLFTETLKKYAKTGAKFTMVQDGPTLKLIIDTQSGERRIIEKDMEKILETARAKHIR